MWSTAYKLAEQKAAQAKLYFIQDYEPLFYPIGDEHFLAAQLSARVTKYYLRPVGSRSYQTRVGLDSETIPFFIDKLFFTATLGQTRSTG